MKRIAYICVILLCSISFAFAQGAKPGRTNTNSKKVVKKTVVSPFAEAEKAWTLFYSKFWEIVKNRERTELKKIMSEDFVGEREEQLKGFDESNPDYSYSQYWERLKEMKKVSRLLRKGELISGVGAINKTPSRIVANKWYDGKEKSACQNSKNDNDNCGWNIAIFEFRNRKWSFVELTFCECE